MLELNNSLQIRIVGTGNYFIEELITTLVKAKLDYEMQEVEAMS
jgi:hypothetical protein